MKKKNKQLQFDVDKKSAVKGDVCSNTKVEKKNGERKAKKQKKKKLPNEINVFAL